MSMNYFFKNKTYETKHMKKDWFKNPVMAILTGLVLVALIIFLGVTTYNEVKEGRYIGRPDTERDTITITGEGRVTAIPDIGQITVGIQTENDDVNIAQEENIEQFNQLVAALKAEGIAEEDLKTSSYNVYPRYDYIEGEQILRGYEVTQSLTIKIRDLDNAGNVITVASQNGVNQVSGLSFTIDEPEQYREEAREEALANAREKARELADLMGVTLGRIVSFSESASGGQPPIPFYNEFAQDGRGGGVSAPDFEAGSEEVVVIATIEYEIY